MNDITVTSEVKTLSSLEVANMINKQHSDLLKAIRQLIAVLAEGNFSSGDWFISSTYKDVNNQERPCYLITKKGCNLIGNKMNGKQGTLFTAQFVSKFEEMERSVVKMNPMQMLELQFQVVKEIDSKVEDVNQDLQTFKQELPLLGIDCDELRKKVNQVAIKALGGYKSPAYEDKSIQTKVYKDIWHEVKREFDVSSYKAICRKQLGTAMEILNKYKLPMALSNLIRDANYHS